MTRLPLTLPGFEGRSVTLQPAGFVSGAKLFVGETPAPKGKRRLSYRLRKNDGTWVDVKLKPRLFDPVPQLECDGRRIAPVRPLYWYEYGWMALPILLAFSGGGLGALVGFGAAHLNSRIFRSDRAVWLRYVLTALASLAAVGVFFIAAAFVESLLGGLRTS
jgi:hypothetical protein